MLIHYIYVLKKLSLAKVSNLFLLWLGFHWSRITRRPRQWGMPFSVSIEPTTSCNLRCPQCPSGLREFSRPTGMLARDDFEKFLSPLRKHLHSLTFYFQGEPYLHPSFLEMVNVADQKNIFTITSTNAHYLNEKNARQTVESGLGKLIISVDGADAETYQQYRVGGQFEKVIEGTREIVRQKKLLGKSTPHVVWQFVVFRQNEHQVDEIRKMGKDLGVNEVTIKTAQIYDHENGHDMIPSIDQFSRYSKNPDGTYRIKNEMRNQCWRMWQGCVITWDGKVVPCCFDKDASHQLGSLKETDFKQIWYSNAYDQFRNSILKSRSEIDICTNCTEGTKVFS